MFLRIFVLSVVVILAPLHCVAQDASQGKTAKAKTVSTAAAASPGAEFSALNAKFRTLVADLGQLRRRYQSDTTANKNALQAEWEQKLDQVKKLETLMASSAEQAYVAAPDKSQDESDYLFAYLTSQVKTDNYEEAVRLVNLLAEHNYQHEYFDLLAGLSYFAVADFDKAKEYLSRAKEQGQIDEIGSRFLAQIDDHDYPELWKKEQAIRAAEDKASNLPRVKLETSKGDIVIALLENEAPLATANFIELTEKKFFDGLKFHRVIPGFMAQGGDPKGDGTGGPGYTIPDECYESDHRNHFRGTLSMANSGQRDTGGSQFFLTFLPTAHLDGKHTVFGRVVEGMDVLSKLQRCQPGDSAVPDRIVKATVLSKRNHRYTTVKRPDK